MTSPAEWLAGARPATLPAAVAPVLVGCGAAAALDGFSWWKALLTMVVAAGLQVGVNYANDYSDGVRGTDHERVGPMQLVGSGAATPSTVRAAAATSFAIAAAAGVVLAVVTAWWLLLIGAAALAAAWGYTGGERPYGYRGLGEVAVFVFFGLVAVLGTTYVQVRRIDAPTAVLAAGTGLLACALLMVNNLRDVDSDAASGKRTLAVLLGAARTRGAFVAMVVTAFAAAAVAAVWRPWCLLALGAAALAVAPCRLVLGRASGPRLIDALRGTARTELAYAALVTVGLVLAR